jgi:isoamylase
VLGNTCEHGCFNFDKLDANTALNRIVRELGAAARGNGGRASISSPSPGRSAATRTRSAASPRAGPSGTASIATICGATRTGSGRRRSRRATLATRFAGSSDLYQDDGRRPWHSINFLVAHDGLTHRDLYACNGKNNAQPWPWGPSDGGTDDNDSWDQGERGDGSAEGRAQRDGAADAERRHADDHRR